MSDTLSHNEESKLIEKFRENFTFSSEGEAPQRRDEEEDLRFQVPEMQWDEDSAASRRGRKDPGGTIILPRPMLSISKIDQPIRLVMNQFRQAKLGVNIHPVSPNATDDTASVLQDLYRRIERDSNANVARGWALDRAVKAGRGVYRVVVRPDEDGFNFGDLEIGIERMLHQGCAYFDPSSQLPDYSDGEFAYVTSWMLLSKAGRTYKSKRALHASSSGLVWDGMKTQAPLWVREDGAGKSIQIAECFYKKHQELLLLILDNGKAVLDGKVPNGRKVVSERVRDQVEVWHAVTDGFDILEKPRLWLGKYIPLIPVLGRELQPFDERRRIIGIIRNARDPQRFYNTSVSTLMERMFLEPRTPWVGPEGFDEGREFDWAQANYRNIPVLKYKPTQYDDRTPHPVPQRTQVDSSGMSVALLGVQQANQDVQEATSFFDPSLGKTSRQEESGRKVLALQGQGDAANGDWLDNLAVAMRYEALCVLDLIPPVYDAAGRVTTVIGGTNSKARKVMLNQPFVVDQNTGDPRAVKKNTSGAKFYDLKTGARYGVDIEIGTSFKTRLQEADEATTRVIEAAPELMMFIGDLLFENKDFPGAKDIADRMERMIRAQHPQLFEEEEGGPEQVAAKAKALEAQLAQVGAQLQQAMQALQTEKVKEDAKVQIETFKVEANKVLEMAKLAMQERLAEMNNAAKIRVAEIGVEKQTLGDAAELQAEELATGLKLTHEGIENAKDRDHERRMQMVDKAHDVGMAAGSGTEVTRTHEGGQEQDQEREDETSQGENSEQSTGASSGPATGGEE